MDDDRDLLEALDYPPLGHDPDDPPTPITFESLVWNYINRSAEEWMRWARVIGII